MISPTKDMFSLKRFFLPFSCVQEIVEAKSLQLVGIVGIYPANAAGDDIEVYADEARAEVVNKFYGLRQQVRAPGCVAGAAWKSRLGSWLIFWDGW